MNIEEKAHDLSVLTLKLLIEKGEYDINFKRNVPDVISEISFEYDRIYKDFVKQLQNLKD